jgi:hypothetical protein
MSCLFNSLSNFINLDSYNIRQKICNYLENNQPIIEGIDTDLILSLDSSKDDYINNMRSTSTWGGAIEIQAACNLWSLRIIIINIRNLPNTQIEFLPLSNNYTHTIKISWNGYHYEPISCKKM